MNDWEMISEIMKLPAPDLITESKIEDPVGSHCFYRADTVVKLIMKEREKCRQ